MLEVVIMLAIIALVLIFLRAGRQNTIVYRKRVASPDYGDSIRDHPSVSAPPVSSDYYTDRDSGTGHATHDALSFEGGAFGGGGAGDSYDSLATDPTGYEPNSFGACESDFTSFDNDFNSCDSGAGDSGNSDSCSDSSCDNSSFSSD